MSASNNFGGRRKEPEWSEFTDIEECKTQVRCNHCNDPVSKRIERMKTHLGKCPKKLSKDKKRKLENNNEIEGEVDDLVDDDNNESRAPPAKKLKLDNFIIRTSDEQKRKFDMQVARFWYSCNLSFKSARNKEWLKLVELLHPGYKPPSDYDLSGKLLNKVFEEVEKEHNEEMDKVDKVIISQDGWESSSRDPILAHSYHTGEKSFLHNIVNCGSNKKDSEYCLGQLRTAIEGITEKKCLLWSQITSQKWFV